ncbi:MAG: CDP-glucose 4,6-dehydratase [Lachnospiraceae bacterium]|nr:CDP-glucose 4,6-dehydratase [Lachnospiraceae bacterium]
MQTVSFVGRNIEAELVYERKPIDLSFYKGKRVLITGHTGFKGSWMCEMLLMAGAEITGYSLPVKELSTFNLINLRERINHVEGDIRDMEKLKKVFSEAKPEIVFHMASQQDAESAYEDPAETYSVNVMGTVNVLDCIRSTPSVRSFINVTTDKVYQEKTWSFGYRENEVLNGYDPYGNSKSCSELLTGMYQRCFFKDYPAITTCRTGDVIGDGSFARDRLMVLEEGRAEIGIDDPKELISCQHVADVVYAYLMIAEKQYQDKNYEGTYNVGPDDDNSREIGDMATSFCEKWNKISGDDLSWKVIPGNGEPKEPLRRLDCAKIKSTFKWNQRWDMDTAMEKIAEWTYTYLQGNNVEDCMKRQIEDFCS